MIFEGKNMCIHDIYFVKRRKKSSTKIILFQIEKNTEDNFAKHFLSEKQILCNKYTMEILQTLISMHKQRKKNSNKWSVKLKQAQRQN